MTQTPHSGQAAPVTTESDDSESRATSPDLDQFAPAEGDAEQTAELKRQSAPPAGGPSPSTPTEATPWGSTSTTASASYGGAEYGGAGDVAGGEPGGAAAAGAGAGETPHWTATPVDSSEAPTTASVPLVTGSAASGQSSTAAGSARSRPRTPRRARLQLRHINPWTVLRFSSVMAVALFFVWLIVVGILFGVLDGAGIIGKINNAYTTIQGGNAEPPVTAGVVFGVAAIVGVVNVVLFIALSTVGSVVYNLCADLVGGIEITLSER